MCGRKRLSPSQRRESILDAALHLSKTEGYNRIRREEVASEAGVSMALITHYFGTMNKFRRAIMRAAITREVLEVVGQGLAIGDSHARKAPEELKQRAAQYIANVK